MFFKTATSQDEGVKIGTMLPEFTLLDQHNQKVSPYQQIGKKYIVVYFYPKDDTPGCTKEACSFRDNYDRFDDLNAVIYGISSDGVEDHKAFAEKYNLNFSLLADVDGKIRKAFNVPTNLLGMIPGRVTYVFDMDGKCVEVLDSQLNFNLHIDESIRVIENLQ